MTGKVLVRYEVCAALTASARACNGQPEAGGILLGLHREQDIEVVGRTMPGPGDSRSLFAFIKVDPLHQAAATAAWHTSGGTQTFVGEWHTHPLGSIEPSSTDLATWRRLARVQKRVMVFVLVVPGSWGLFLTTSGLLRSKVTRLAISEHGRTGLVFSTLDNNLIIVGQTGRATGDAIPSERTSIY